LFEEGAFDLSSAKWDESPFGHLLVGVIPGIEQQPLPTEGENESLDGPAKALEILQTVLLDHLTELMASSSIADN
jgi:hypothetical protein